jgi:hypothetical protein
VTSVVTLLSNAEFAEYGVTNLLDAYRAAGLEVLHRAVKDQGVPTHRAGRAGACSFLKQATDANKKVLGALRRGPRPHRDS